MGMLYGVQVPYGNVEATLGSQLGMCDRPGKEMLRENRELIGAALYGAVRRVVWDPGANYSQGSDSSSCLTA
jgi:hypothetical protein